MSRLMQHDRDPAEAIREEVGDIESVQLFYSQILVGIYKRPERTRSGIILTDKARDEDVYQGKVGLVLKKGPTAFRDDPENKIFFHNQDVQKGDWIVFRPSDGWALSLNGTTCRVLQDVHVRARIPQPDIVW